MRILVTGRGTSGSWQVRGVQLGKAIGATVSPNASDLEIRAHDLVILVKRPTPQLLERIHQARKPLVWDQVDSWPQPEGNRWARGECMAWLEHQVKTIKPAGIVAATQEMAFDCGWGAPDQTKLLWLPHHSRSGQDANPIREQVQTVGYEGGLQYLEGWLPHIERQCATRGWRFHVAPKRLADLDIVLALRTDTGYAPRNWKSAVKAANAMGTGTPIIACREGGYLEVDNGGMRWADTPLELSRAFDELTPKDARAAAAARLKLQAPFVALDRLAKEYARWLETI
jgi:hypothetical protein